MVAIQDSRNYCGLQSRLALVTEVHIYPDSLKEDVLLLRLPRPTARHVDKVWVDAVFIDTSSRLKGYLLVETDKTGMLS